ncbi:MAG TPA: dihydrodipicolinate synthase family protein [Methylomirabilota bacterium]|nr:dihydrodipicolinate synthase family protein [Methylomirabilota bacterium]
MALPRPLRGIVPPLVTPLRDRDELDVAGLERLLEHVLAGGVSGLFVLGTTGEAASLGYRLRYELVQRVCKQVAGRVPVLVGITDTAFVESVRLAAHAADSGAQAVVLSSPYYHTVAQPELCEYLQHIVPELPLPVFLYNMPSLTKVPFALETLRRAMDLPQVVGIKDSSGDMGYFHQVGRLLAERPEWSLLIGPEDLLADAVLLAGAHGGVNGGANLVPRLYVELYEAAARRDLARVAELHGRVVRIVGTLYAVGHHGSAVIKGLKCALSLMGICDDFMAEPFRRFRAPEREAVRRHLLDLGLVS